MNLTELLANHKEKTRKTFIEAIASKNALTPEQVISQYMDFIEQQIDKRYEPVGTLISKLSEFERPVFLVIRRDRLREDRCKICEANEPNVREIDTKYKGRVELFEVIEDRPEGALYQIIFHEESEEKKLPLTALINKGELLKFWAGKTVDASVYEKYIKKVI